MLILLLLHRTFLTSFMLSLPFDFNIQYYLVLYRDWCMSALSSYYCRDGLTNYTCIHFWYVYNYNMYTTFWATESSPANLVNPNLTVLFKKGDRAECGNYRGISLLSTVGKLLADILLQRLQNILADIYPESQHGYRSGRGTIGDIFTVR